MVSDSAVALQRAERELWFRYRAAPALTRAYVRVRLRIFPKRRVWPILMDLSGTVVSVGAGYGLMETMAAIANPSVRFIASDARQARIALARQATSGIPNIDFEVFNLQQGLPEHAASAFLLFDVLHHLAPPVQQSLLAELARRLPSGGRIVIKECGVRPLWKLWFNYLTDMVSAPGEATYPRAEEDWATLLSAHGLRTTVTRIDRGTPYVHVLIEAQKP